MAKLTKRQKKFSTVKDTIDIQTALSLIKKNATAKFDESVDIAVRLGIDARKSDQMVRGSVVLPNGTGKVVRIAVFAQGDDVLIAKNAGADIVGFEDLIDNIKRGIIEFDVAIAHPDVMRSVSAVGQILGPRGLMPNPKSGTVTTNIEVAVKNARFGQVQYRNDKGGIIHAQIGKASFQEQLLEENLLSVLKSIVQSKPQGIKKQFILGLSINSTMGAGFSVQIPTTVGVK